MNKVICGLTGSFLTPDVKELIKKTSEPNAMKEVAILAQQTLEKAKKEKEVEFDAVKILEDFDKDVSKYDAIPTKEKRQEKEKADFRKKEKLKLAARIRKTFTHYIKSLGITNTQAAELSNLSDSCVGDASTSKYNKKV